MSLKRNVIESSSTFTVRIEADIPVFSSLLLSHRQLDLLNSLGGIGGLLGQPVKKQLGILQTLGGVTDPSDLLTRRENLNGEAMKYVHTLLAERSTDGKGQRPVTRAAANTSTGDCSVGKAQCCDQVINDKSKKKTLGLAGLNEIAGSIALSCTQLPIGILPIAAQNTCKSSPVCCNSVTQDGLVNVSIYRRKLSFRAILFRNFIH